MCKKSSEDVIEYGCSCKPKRYAHIHCKMLECVKEQEKQNICVWFECPKCSDAYDGGMQHMLLLGMLFRLCTYVYSIQERFYVLAAGADIMRKYGHFEVCMCIMQELLKVCKDLQLSEQTKACEINIAHILTLQEQYEEAEKRLTMILETCEDQKILLECHEKLGKNLEDQGKYNKAAEHFKRVVALRTQSVGSCHKCTIQARVMWLGAMCQERQKEAAPFLSQTLQEAQGVFGNDHKLTLRCACHYMACLTDLGEDKKARDVGEMFGIRQAETEKKVITHKITTECVICKEEKPLPITTGCSCRGSVGYAHIECVAKTAQKQENVQGYKVWRECTICREKYTGAMQQGLSIIFLSRTALQGLTKKTLFVAANAVSEVFETFGLFTVCENIFKDTMKIYDEMIQSHEEGDGECMHYRTLSMLKCGYLKTMQGQYFEAEICLNEIMEHCDNEHTKQDCLLQMGMLLVNSCRYLEARKVMESVVDSLKHSDGVDAPKTIMAMDFLGMILCKLHDYESAAPVIRITLCYCAKRNGLKHPKTQAFARILSMCLYKMNCVQESLEIMQKHGLDPNFMSTIQENGVLSSPR